MKLKETIDNVVEVLLWLVMAFVIALSLHSCAPARVVTITTSEHDTVHHAITKRDSIYLHDSIYLKEWQQGETIYINKEKWHTQYRDRWHHDSIYINKCDTIYRESVTEVARPLRWWQYTLMGIGVCAILSMLFLLWLIVVRR